MRCSSGVNNPEPEEDNDGNDAGGDHYNREDEANNINIPFAEVGTLNIRKVNLKVSFLLIKMKITKSNSFCHFQKLKKHTIF